MPRLNALFYFLYHALELFHFNSRINRTKFYLLLLFWIVVMPVFSLMLASRPYLFWPILIVCMVHLFLLGKSRLNDMNMSGLWILILFLTIWFIGTFFQSDMEKLAEATGRYFVKFLLLIGLFPGSKEGNKYGEVPKLSPKNHRL